MFQFELLTKRDWLLIAAFWVVLAAGLYFGMHWLVAYYAGTH
jgi:hypothetical protein